MDQPRFPIEFKSAFVEEDLTYYAMIEDRLNKLAKNHTDITGAAATLEQLAKGRETPYVFEASVVVYTRPTHISGTEKHSDPRIALKGALDAVERQVREQREKLGHGG